MTLPIGDYGLMHGFIAPLPFTLYTRVGEVQPAGMSEQAAIPVRLGPNPCSDRLWIHDATNTTYRVVDASGRTVMQGEPVNGSLDIQHLAPGSYTLRSLVEPRRRALFVVAR